MVILPPGDSLHNRCPNTCISSIADNVTSFCLLVTGKKRRITSRTTWIYDAAEMIIRKFRCFTLYDILRRRVEKNTMVELYVWLFAGLIKDREIFLVCSSLFSSDAI